MLTWKIALYVVTIASAFLFAAVEMGIRNRLKERIERQQQNPSDFGLLNDFRTQASVESLLGGLSEHDRTKYRCAVILKFGFFALFAIEVIVLQR